MSEAPQFAENDAPVTGARFVRLTGTCPHCGLRKNQIDTSEAHAVQVLDAAFDRHIREEHPTVIPSEERN